MPLTLIGLAYCERRNVRPLLWPLSRSQSGNRGKNHWDSLSHSIECCVATRWSNKGRTCSEMRDEWRGTGSSVRRLFGERKQTGCQVARWLESVSRVPRGEVSLFLIRCGLVIKLVKNASKLSKIRPTTRGGHLPFPLVRERDKKRRVSSPGVSPNPALPAPGREPTHPRPTGPSLTPERLSRSPESSLQ